MNDTDAEDVDIWDFVALADCQSIVLTGKNWSTFFEDLLVRPEEVRIAGGKEAKTQWILRMSAIKNKLAKDILWLAIHIAFSKKTSENTEQSASFLKGFMLQFVNVKIYMFGVTALTGYVVGYMSSFPALLFFELVIATIGTIATCTWIGLGVLIQKFYLRHFRVINIILALTLLECIWGMLR